MLPERCLIEKGPEVDYFDRDSSCISDNVSSPFFIANNATVTAYLLELPLAQFKKFRLPFCTYVFFRVQVPVKDENILLPLSGLFTVVYPLPGREQKIHIQPKLSCVSL